MKSEGTPVFPLVAWLVIVFFLLAGLLLVLFWPVMNRPPAIKEELTVLATRASTTAGNLSESLTPLTPTAVSPAADNPVSGDEMSATPAADTGEAAVLPLPVELLPTATTSPTVSLVAPLTPTVPISVSAGSFAAVGQPERPVWVRIPSIGVNAGIEAVGLTAANAMATPQDWNNVGWYDLGYWPGQPGNAVMTGHLDAPGSKPAVFWRLKELRPGDRILVVMESGRTLAFVVIESVYYPYDDAPLWRIFGPSGESRLNLITCRGDWDRQLRTYDHRLVVYTRQIGYELIERPRSLPVE